MPTEQTLARFIARVRRPRCDPLDLEFSWKDGERIEQEQFFHDPNQFERSKT